MRSWRAEDREPFAEMNADPEVMRYLPEPLTRAESDALVDRLEGRLAAAGYGLWALEVVESGEFIGFTGLNPMPDGVPGAGGMEIGWRLRRSAWSHGYATEAGLAALAVAFDQVGLGELWSLTAVGNAPSRAVMSRLGLTHVATQDHPKLAANSPLLSHVFYRIGRAEYADRCASVG
ncbi:MAG: GNAT family N-acetyltransferase [Propionibacteriales bacterium]|nr:GNAT family N-acetyltransferase [Propionibacteriales bacterium]